MKKRTVILVSAAAIAVLFVLTIGIVFLPRILGFSDSRGDFSVTVGNASGKKGETVSVPVTVSGNPGTIGYLLDFRYDSSILQYAGYETGGVLADCELSDKNGSVRMIGMNDADTEKNGKLVTLQFKVLSDSGKSEIELICDEKSICNYDEQTFVPTVKNGTVTVKK